MEKMEVLKEKRGLISGNEAIVRGALESGVAFASSYAGTPASEIGNTFASIAREAGIYFEWSTNEKVALEVAAGAAFSGVKSLVAMKHYGLNVALDSLMPLAYFSCPLVVVVADDPGCFSSIQTEQDSRYFAKLSKIPMFEPSNAQEALDMTKEAFKLAWLHKTPVIIRLTTRVCYAKSIVNFGRIVKTRAQANFKKKEFNVGRTVTVGLHEKILKKIAKIKELSEKSVFNSIEKAEGKIGVITCGVSYEYVKEAFEKLNITLPLFKVGFSYPFPAKKIQEFLKNLSEVIVIEELDPIMEEEIQKIFNGKIYGKQFFSETDEFKPENVLIGLAKILNKSIAKEILKASIDVERRLPFFCPGCPHRATFYAVAKTLSKDKIFGGDIGCYLLAANEPFKLLDYIVAMGAGIGISHGISKTTGKKTVAFIGDSTFLHGGIPALINLVYNKANALVIILDNRWTAMTGHQPNPVTGITAMGNETKIIDIEQIVKACKVDFVRTSQVYNFDKLCSDIKDAYEYPGVSVIVAKGECRLAFVRQASRKGVKLPKYQIIKQKPELNELTNFDCPAIQREKRKKGKWFIDQDLCWGCSICRQLYPDCIEIVKENTEEQRKGVLKNENKKE